MIILVIVDRFSKYAHFLSFSHPFIVVDIAHISMDNVYKLHEFPQCIVSDRDAIFTSNFLKIHDEKVGS
jgi:hypothetical protein